MRSLTGPVADRWAERSDRPVPHSRSAARATAACSSCASPIPSPGHALALLPTRPGRDWTIPAAASPRSGAASPTSRTPRLRSGAPLTRDKRFYPLGAEVRIGPARSALRRACGLWRAPLYDADHDGDFIVVVDAHSGMSVVWGALGA